jgi:hypothetical protein
LTIKEGGAAGWDCAGAVEGSSKPKTRTPNQTALGNFPKNRLTEETQAEDARISCALLMAFIVTLTPDLKSDMVRQASTGPVTSTLFS